MKQEGILCWSIVALSRGELVTNTANRTVFTEAVGLLKHYLSNGAYRAVIIDLSTQTPLVMVHNPLSK